MNCCFVCFIGDLDFLFGDHGAASKAFLREFMFWCEAEMPCYSRFWGDKHGECSPRTLQRSYFGTRIVCYCVWYWLLVATYWFVFVCFFLFPLFLLLYNVCFCFLAAMANTISVFVQSISVFKFL